VVITHSGRLRFVGAALAGPGQEDHGHHDHEQRLPLVDPYGPLAEEQPQEDGRARARHQRRQAVGRDVEGGAAGLVDVQEDRAERHHAERHAPEDRGPVGASERFAVERDVFLGEAGLEGHDREERGDEHGGGGRELLDAEEGTLVDRRVLEVGHDVDATRVRDDVEAHDHQERGRVQEVEGAGFAPLEDDDGQRAHGHEDRHPLLPVDLLGGASLPEEDEVDQHTDDDDQRPHDDHGDHDAEGEGVHQGGGGDHEPGCHAGQDDPLEVGSLFRLQVPPPAPADDHAVGDDHAPDERGHQEGHGVEVGLGDPREVLGAHPEHHVRQEVTETEKQEDLHGSQLPQHENSSFCTRFTESPVRALPGVPPSWVWFVNIETSHFVA